MKIYAKLQNPKPRLQDFDQDDVQNLKEACYTICDYAGWPRSNNVKAKVSGYDGINRDMFWLRFAIPWPKTDSRETDHDLFDAFKDIASEYGVELDYDRFLRNHAWLYVQYDYMKTDRGKMYMPRVN